MADDADIYFTCADFGSPVLDRIRERFPDRFANVGIAEQNLINVSAGLAPRRLQGVRVRDRPRSSRCAASSRSGSTSHCCQKVRSMNVNLIGVGAGYSYVVSGPTHQCYEDLTVMRALPNVAIYSPADHVSAAALFDQCLANTGPKYLRLDAQVLPVGLRVRAPGSCARIQRASAWRHVCLVATGYMLHTALKVAEQLAASGPCGRR